MADLYRDSIVIDCLNGSALTPSVVARLHEAGVTAINLTAVEIGKDFVGALRDLAVVAEAVERHADRLCIVREPEDVRRAKREGRVGLILGMQDGEPLARDLSRLRTLADLGVRIIQLTHNRQNFLGTGCAEPDSGLTRFGRQVVAEMNRLGIIVDLSHCGPRTTLDAIAASATPVAITHANPRTLCDSPRNKDDETIRRLAEKGGVIGIAGWSPIVCREPNRRPSLEDVLACLDHAVAIAGPAHVGIGTDLCEEAQATAAEWERIYGPHGQYPEITGGLGEWYGFATVMAKGLEFATQIPGLARGMLSHGHAPEQVRDILGANFLRVFETVRAGRC